MDEQRKKLIIRSIAIAIEDEQDAFDFIAALQKEDWQQWMEKINSPVRWRDRPCIVCGETVFCGDGPASGMCNACWLKNGSIIIKISSHKSRARAVGLPATLTVREWYATLYHFESKCAYCQEVSAKTLEIEHFIPIHLGGGTTQGNCIPSCSVCNHKKKKRHPLDVKDRFPEGAIERVQLYLSQFQ